MKERNNKEEVFNENETLRELRKEKYMKIKKNAKIKIKIKQNKFTEKKK